jgi:quercetin dioxygenase-like cupin family protein
MSFSSSTRLFMEEEPMTNSTWTRVIVIVAVCVGSAPAHAKEAAKLVQIPAGELKWEPFYPGGPEEAFILGSKEAKKGPTAFFIKFKAGFDSGWHFHESAYTAVILSGTIVETDKAADPPKPLVAGSYYMQPKTVHRTQCAPGADCLVYIYEDGPFSFTPSDESGKPLPPPAK